MRQRDGVISEAIYYVCRPRRPRGIRDLSNKCYNPLGSATVNSAEITRKCFNNIE